MKTTLTVTTAASDNCLTSSEVKAELKVETSDEDSVLAMKLDAAERLVEEYCNRRLMKTVLAFTLDGWPSGGIVLPVNPIVSITSVKYYDTSNVQQTWDTANYHYNVNEEPCIIRYVNDVPSLYDDRSDKVQVAFTVGYSSSDTVATQQAAVPPMLKQAILKLVGDLHIVRADSVREKFTAWQVYAYPYRVFHHPTEND